jgi:dihydropteroate synthase
MHAQGDPRTMQLAPHYDDALLDVFDYLAARLAACEAAGISRRRLVVDPGIGFGKNDAHNLDLLRGVALFHALGCAVLVGVSRKSLIGRLAGAAKADDRLPGSLALAAWLVSQGVQVVRVHDVAATRQALALWRRVAE